MLSPALNSLYRGYTSPPCQPQPQLVLSVTGNMQGLREPVNTAEPAESRLGRLHSKASRGFEDIVMEKERGGLVCLLMTLESVEFEITVFVSSVKLFCQRPEGGGS